MTPGHVVCKADVQGSAEAIGVTLGKIGNDEVKVRVLLSGVAPRADAASVCYGTLSADGGFEPFIVRALTPDAPFVP